MILSDGSNVIELNLSEIFGTGVLSIEQTETSLSPGGINEITCTLTNGTVTKFYIRNGTGGGGGGLTDDVKTAILQLAQKVAYIDDEGADYYQDLYEALYPSRTISYITCTFDQNGATIYDTASLNSLKQYLTVTAYYDDSSTEDVTTSAVLSGTLTVGTSTITATYGGKSATFNVAVTAAPTVTSISAVFTQGGATIYDTDTLDSLKQYLTVTATYSDTTTADVTAEAVLSGTLEVGASTITATYSGQSDTFTVTVSKDVPNTNPVITDYDVRLANNGYLSEQVGMCVTDYYDVNDISLTSYNPCPDTTVTYSVANVIGYNENGGVVNHWNMANKTAPAPKNISSGSPVRIRVTLYTSGIADGYMYETNTGNIIYAGTDSPYYGMSNISEAQ